MPLSWLVITIVIVVAVVMIVTCDVPCRSRKGEKKRDILLDRVRRRRGKVEVKKKKNRRDGK